MFYCNLVRICNCKQTGNIPQSQLINMQVKDREESISHYNLSSPLFPSTKCILMSQSITQESTNVKRNDTYLIYQHFERICTSSCGLWEKGYIYNKPWFYNLLLLHLKFEMVTHFPAHYQHNAMLILWSNFLKLHRISSIQVFWSSPSLIFCNPLEEAMVINQMAGKIFAIFLKNLSNISLTKPHFEGF